jgi:probable phosphoglycerate mutase
VVVPVTTVLAVRHGQSTWNAEGRWQGHADPPLSTLGLAQARAAVAAIGAVDAVVASDLVRARDTAVAIADALGVGPVVIEENLRETDAGPWTGLTRAEIAEGWPGWLAEGRRPDGFEAAESVTQRGRAALVAIHREYPGGTVLAVTHAGVIRAVERSCGADDGVLPNLGARYFTVDGDSLTLGDRLLLINPDEIAITVPTAL